MTSDFEPLAEGLEKIFGRLGLPDPRVMSAVMSEWEQLAAPPWSGNSRPVVVRGRTLVVEAAKASQVAFLRYGISTLLATLSERFGPDAITGVEVVPPRR